MLLTAIVTYLLRICHVFGHVPNTRQAKVKYRQLRILTKLNGLSKLEFRFHQLSN